MPLVRSQLGAATFPASTPLERAVCAMNEAADRVSRVAWNDPGAVFSAIGEALWWIVVVDTSLEEGPEGAGYLAKRQVDPAGRLLLGLRHARNRFAHDFTIVEYVDPSAQLDADRRGYATMWRWRSLPPSPDRRGLHGREEYETLLAGRDVHGSFVDVLTFLRGAAWGLPTRTLRVRHSP